MESFRLLFRGNASLVVRRSLRSLYPISTVSKNVSPFSSASLQVLRSRISTSSRFGLRTKHVYRKQSIQRRYSQRPSNSPPNPTPNLGSPEPQSLSARLKKLSREYGYTVIGVYLALTVADFPFCFLAVKFIGAERVAYAEHVVVGGAKSIINRVFPDMFKERAEEEAEAQAVEASKDASEAESGDATIWTQLALAFVIHKSFIFIRVPLTAAITPKVVKTLRGWGYNIGKRTPKAK